MIDNSFQGVDTFNRIFEPVYTIEQICNTMMKATDMKRYIPLISGGLLMFAAGVLGTIGGIKLVLE